MESASTRHRVALAEAVRIYWRSLAGVATFGPLLLVTDTFIEIPFWIVLFPFFLVMGLAMWPWLSGRAPYTFWVLALGVWMAGGFVGVLARTLINVVAG